MSTDSDWYVAVTKYGKELIAIDRITAFGHRAHQLRCRRRYRSTNRNRQEEPVIRGYLLVSSETFEGLSEIWTLDEIEQVLGSGPRSSVLSPEEVERLDEIAHESITEQIKVIREDYKIGAMARIRYGPLEGADVRILSIKGDGDKEPWVAIVGIGSFKDSPLGLDILEPLS